MNLALSKPAIITAAAPLVLTLVIQTRRISRIWLRWLPSKLRGLVDPFFDPPPSVHPGTPDPNKIEVEDEALLGEKFAAAGGRIVLSAMHGVRDLEHYFARFTIAFVVISVVLVVLLALAAGITSL
jgi:hypothetical protein